MSIYTILHCREDRRCSIGLNLLILVQASSKLRLVVQVKGYKSTSESNVPGLPFLLAIVVGLIVATVVVTSQTAGGPPPQSSPDSQASPAAVQE